MEAAPADPAGGRVMLERTFQSQTYSTPLCVRLDKAPTAPPGPEERVLGPFILPPFQRPPVWTLAQKVRFIESIWIGLPIGACVLNVTHWPHPTHMWLLDGQQRWRAILEYFAGAYPVGGMLYPDIPVREQRRFEMGTIFPEVQCNMLNPAECEDVYNRLAYGGTPHETPTEQ